MNFTIANNMELLLDRPASYANKAKYRLGRTIRFSTYGIMKEAEGPTGKVAVKITPKKNLKGNKQMILYETEILQRIIYPKPIKVVDYFESKDNLYLVTQWVTTGEVFNSICEKDASQTLRQFLEGIDSLLENNIVHEAVKGRSLYYFNPTHQFDLVLTDSDACMNRSGYKFSSVKTPPAYSDPVFHAKEVAQTQITPSYYKKSSQTMSKYSVTTSLEDQEIIWNSSASHLSATWFHLQQEQLADLSLDLVFGKATFQSTSDRFFKGWNEEWGNLQVRSPSARTGKSLDRDYVWVMTQTMVSFENLAFSQGDGNSYKVYPGFWGRRIPSLTPRGLLYEANKCVSISIPLVNWVEI